MYIEANYTRRWNGRKPGAGAGGGGGGTYGPDLSAPNPHWANSASIRSTKSRKPLVHQPQCIQQPNLQQSHSIFRSMTESSSLNSPSLRQTMSVHSGMGRESLARELADDFRAGRSGIDPSNPRVGSPDLLNFSPSFHLRDQSDNFSFGYYNNGPGRLPDEIAMRLKERFDHRMLRHWIKSHKHSPYASLLPDGFTYQTDKHVRYQLLAAFLVDKGQVEAWYPYAPMPSNIQSSPETGGRTRLLELTQRRLRLLQRYYAEARQYVVLYVNSSHSEHYLPMGLANDDRSSKTSDTSNKSHKSNQSDLVKDGHKAVWRFLASMLSGSRLGSLANSNDESPGNRPKSSLRHFRCMSCGTLKDPEQENQAHEKRSKREHSQPKSETSMDDLKCSSSSSSSATSNAGNQENLNEVQNQKINFVKRFLENFWLSHTNQDQAKNRRSAKSSSTTADEDQNEFKHHKSNKDTLSIGLIDLSSTTDSITSENTTPTQLDEAPSCGISGLERGLSSGSGKLADGEPSPGHQVEIARSSDTDEVWLPKNSSS